MKNLSYLFFGLILFLTVNVQAQKFEWIELAGGPSYENVFDMALDDKYIYVTGYYTNTMTFGSTTINSLGGTDVYLAKYDTLGNFYWVKSYGGRGNVGYRSSLSIDSNGDVIMTGTYTDTISFGNLNLYSTSYYYSNFIVKVSSSGNPIWAKSIDYDNLSFFYYNYISLTTIGTDIYVHGNAGDSLLYDGSYLGKGGERNFVFKIDANGTLIWDKYLELKGPFRNYYNYEDRIVSDESGFIYLAGVYEDTLQTASFSVHATGNMGNPDIFIAKFDTSGTARWLRTSADSNYSYLSDLVIDRSGDIYITGVLYNSMYNPHFKLKWDTLTLNGEGQYLVKMDPGGNPLWGKIYGQTSTLNTYYSGISIGNDKNIFISSTFSNSFTLWGDDSLVSRGYSDALMLKIDSTGDLLWGQQAGGGGAEYGTAVVADQFGNAYFAGQYSGLSLFGTRTVSTVNGSNDIFLLKLSECRGFQAGIQAIGDTVSCDASISIRLKADNDLGYDFQWMKNQMALAGENYPNLFPIDSGDYAVIINNNGCLDTSRTITITFDTVPDVSFQAAFDSICAADAPVQLSGGTPLGGTWSGLGVNNGFFDPSLADTGSVKITYSFSNGLCADSVSQFIYVSPAPQPKISGLQQVCENTTGISYSTNSPGPDYNWNVSGGSLVSGQGSNSIVVNWGSSGRGIVQLTETNAGGCQNVLSDTIAIADPQISADITGQDTVCINSGNYTYSVTAPSYIYNWNVNGGSIVSGQGTSTVKVNWNSPGNGILSVRLFNSCGSDSTFYDTVLVSPKPNPSISGLNQVCENSSGVAYSSNTTGPDYTWKITNGNITSGQATSSIQVSWSSSGSGTIQLIESNANNCVDSTSLNVDIKEVKDSSFSASICYGSSFSFGGSLLNASGTYYDTLQASNGCDSTIALNLTVLPKIDTSITADICTGESYLFAGQFLSSPGTYYDTLSAVNACDSTIVLNLNVLQAKDSSISATICSGTSYMFDGKALTQAGNYKDTLTASNGCDSIVDLTLNLLPAASSSMTETICSNESFLFDGKYLTTQGTYKDTIPAVNGCDSVITLNLYVLSTISNSKTVNICFGETYLFDGHYLGQSGTYRDTLIAVNGCDSLITLNLMVSKKLISNIDASICLGESYNFDNRNLSVAGTYYDTLKSVNSCDSILILGMEVLSHSSAQINASICSGEEYSLGNQRLTQAGTYKDTLLSANGCDSVVSLNLSVLPTASSTLNDTICSNDTYYFAGKYLSVAGSYTDTLSSVNSCDSVVSLNLYVLKTSSSLIDVSICSGGSYQFNGQSLSLSGIYKDTLINSNACDSILTLDLEVNQVDVSVNVINDSLIAQATTASYQWLTCNTSTGTYNSIPGATSAIYKATANGSYAVEVSQNSCTDTSKCIPVLISGVEEKTGDFSLNVFPNPTGGMLFIEGEIEYRKEVAIRILNMLGEVILMQSKTAHDGKLKSSFNIEGYSKGMYFVEIEMGENKLVRKIVLQ